MDLKVARAALIVALAAAAGVHFIKSDVVLSRPDDRLLRETSARILRGEWSRIWDPQHIHFVPLYRLARLPFDAGFPVREGAFHVAVVAMHLAAAALLFALLRPVLRNPLAAIAAAFLFACSTVGDEAMVWKAASPFVFSWTFLLLGLWLLTRNRPLAALAALAAAAGFFSGVLFVLPGVAAGCLGRVGGVRRRSAGRPGPPARWRGRRLRCLPST